MDDHETGDQQGAFWYNGEKSAHLAAGQFVHGGFLGMGGSSVSQIEVGSSNVVWTAVHNRFFALIAVPSTPAERAIIRDFPLPRPSKEQLEADGKLNPKPQAYQAALIYPATNLAAGQAVEQKFNVYAGPKEYFTLSQLEPQLDLVVIDFTGPTGFFAKGLLLCLNAIHHFIPSLRLEHHRHHRDHQGPVLAADRREHALDEAHVGHPAAAQGHPREVQGQLGQAERADAPGDEREQGEPGGGLPADADPDAGVHRLLLHAAHGHRAASASTSCGSRDLSQPDTLFVIPGLGFLPFLGISGVGLPINLLPIFMGCTSLYLASLTPPSPQMDPAQQKMMKYMPVFFALFLYNYSSGLTLYWTVQNLITVPAKQGH
jgi:YidC/Oxa1 family membrane protein insertase